MPLLIRDRNQDHCFVFNTPECTNEKLPQVNSGIAALIKYSEIFEQYLEKSIK